MIQLTFSSLVDFALRKGLTPLSFQSLVEQLNHKQEIQPNEIKALVGSPHPLHPSRIAYITYSSLSSQSTPLKLANIISNLSIATDLNQRLILNAYISELRNEQVGKHLNNLTNFEINELISSINSHVKYLLDQRQENTQFYGSFASFLNSVLLYLPVELTLSIITQEQNEILALFVNELRTRNLPISEDLEAALAKFTKKPSVIGSLRQSISSASQNNLNVNTHASFIKSNKLPRYIWLNKIIQSWNSHKDHFITAFEQFVKVKTNQNILNELISASFEGYTIAFQVHEPTSFFLKNWKLFLLKRLPILIKSLNLKNVDSSVTNAINLIDPKISQSIKQANGGDADSTIDDMFSSFPSTTLDIRHDFLRDCISAGLLSQGAFSAILKQDAAADSRPLPTAFNPINTQDISEKLNLTLFDVNTEFTSLEDSGLLEFLRTIPEMEGAKQEETSKLILAAILQLTSEDNSSQLYRLSLGLGLSIESLHVILFHVSPTAFLRPLMNYLDSWDISNDEINLQDAYSAFGGIFLLLLLIVKRLNISLDDLISLKPQINSTSFCVSYLSRLGTCVQIDAHDSYKSEVLTSWVNALFDSGGISDELMRVSTAHECFDLFPNIFQQAFIGCKQNILDVETVKGGLEYFLQPFLVGTTVGIFAWSEAYLWRHQDIGLLVNLLRSLSNPSELSGESVHLHQIVLSIYGAELNKVLSKIDKNVTRIEPQLLLSLQDLSRNDASPAFFELRITDTGKAEKTSDPTCVLEIFHNSFYGLINWSQSSSIPLFDYQQFSNLIDFLHPSSIIDYLVDQIIVSQTTNSKNFQLLLEFSAFLLHTHYVGFSREDKTSSIQALKSSQWTGLSKTNAKGFEFLKALIIKKKTPTKDELHDEIFKILYNKIQDCVQQGITL